MKKREALLLSSSNDAHKMPVRSTCQMMAPASRATQLLIDELKKASTKLNPKRTTVIPLSEYFP
jgi:hypothetical protein